MLRNTVYYNLKPFVPRALRTAVRRQLALRRRSSWQVTWPIMPGSERRPSDWAGWPEGKQFALVLTHDVESPAGLEKCRALMQVEIDLGFRSSFNFVPEGSYRVPASLRHELGDNGFEVGVHDLKHDGRLFRSAATFQKRAIRINKYLREWNVTGFRSGFMLHNLDWLHRLEVDYDMSTFDTDPFEPQPKGHHTIFPFWVPRPSANSHSPGPAVNSSSEGYVELPYTLAQDSTLFLLLRETSIEVWKNKLDWIAQHGGMVLLNTHPDYMAMTPSPPTKWEYPVCFYEELLKYIDEKYAGAYWHALPHQVSDLIKARNKNKSSSANREHFAPHFHRARQTKLWIDLDNTPHVPLFEPIIDELKARGFSLIVTARDAFQVCELAQKKRLDFSPIGRHHGKHRLLKGAGLVYRAMQLAPTVMLERPVLAISHGARSQLLASKLLGIPTLLMEDYEYCEFPAVMGPTWLLIPEVISEHSLPQTNGRVHKYRGIKEDIYVWKLRPDFEPLRELGLEENDLIATVRPPATEAHYHNPDSELLFERFMRRAVQTDNTKIILLPRNHKQAELIRGRWPEWFKDGKTIIPSAALDGLNLAWHSDLVVSGGGTMNREAAALGVPVYSIFRGKIGAVDRHLAAEHRLVLIQSFNDIDEKIILSKRTRSPLADFTSQDALHQVVDKIQQIAESYCARS